MEARGLVPILLGKQISDLNIEILSVLFFFYYLLISLPYFHVLLTKVSFVIYISFVNLISILYYSQVINNSCKLLIIRYLETINW